MKFTLGKEERLKSKKQIEQLFAEGESVKSYPLRFVYLQTDNRSEDLIRVGFSVPKRNIKLAVNRIRIKRLLREVYRLNKNLFSENLKAPYIGMFIYLAREEIKYEDLELAIKKISTKFSIKITEDEKEH